MTSGNLNVFPYWSDSERAHGELSIVVSRGLLARLVFLVRRGVILTPHHDEGD